MTALVPTALALLLQSTTLLLLGLVALRLTQGRGPAVQTLIGRATLGSIALLLLLSPLMGHVQTLWHVTLEPTSPRASAPQVLTPRRVPKREGQEVEALLAAPDPMTAPNAASQGAAYGKVIADNRSLTPEAGAISKHGAASSAPTNSLMPPSGGGVGGGFFVGLYAAVTTLLLLWLTVCLGHLTHLRRTALPLTSGPAAGRLAELSPRPPQLLTHPSVRSPFLAGVARPAIFLPPTYATDFDTPALRAILAHELAHRDRRDNAWTLASRLLCALLWPQPLLWLLCRRLEMIAEDACDAAVLASNCPPRAYADCLLTLAERHPLPRRRRALGAGVAPYRSSLGRRVQRILTQGNQTMLPVSPKMRLTIAALTLAAVLGGVCLVSSAPTQVTLGKVLSSPSKSLSSSLIGTWLCSHNDGTGTILIFSKNGGIEEVGPWPGESREAGHSYSSNSAVGHSYGHYTVAGSKLKYTFTRVWVEGEKPWTTYPERHEMDYTLSGGTLTLRWNGNRVAVSHRVPAYTTAMLGLKPNTSPSPTNVEIARYLLGTAPIAAPEVKSLVVSSEELNQARFLAGLTAVQGPGVVVTLNDSKLPTPGKMPTEMAPPNLIHDTDINQVVNELKAAGAEAIAVNGQRLVATSAVRQAGPTILVNNVPQTPPYVIQAIGNSEVLGAALNIPRGIASQIKSYDSAMFSLKTAPALTLPAYADVDTPRYAKPLTSAPSQKTEAKPKQPAALTTQEVRQQALQL